MRTVLDKTNKTFWEEICGTSQFKSLGFTEISTESLSAFDSWYFHYYPYLMNYLPLDELCCKTVLEIGLGFGTIGQKLFMSAKHYTGIDYAASPVDLMNCRIKYYSKGNAAMALHGDARCLPFEDETFDFIVSIGCLHHTGDIERSVNEVYRVLKNGGQTLIMLYNKNSFRRQIILPVRYVFSKLFGKSNSTSYDEFVRSAYDFNSNLQAAPIITFASKKDVKRIFSKFQKNISIKTENFGGFSSVPRKLLLFLGTIWGLDLYITAKK